VPSPSLRGTNALKVSFYENVMSLGAKTDICFAFRFWLACELIVSCIKPSVRWALTMGIIPCFMHSENMV
jgi:hypothetical protein